MLIVVARRPRRAFVPAGKAFACGGYPSCAVTEAGKGCRGLLVAEVCFEFDFPHT